MWGELGHLPDRAKLGVQSGAGSVSRSTEPSSSSGPGALGTLGMGSRQLAPGLELSQRVGWK
jgi:hypothetical protein